MSDVVQRPPREPLVPPGGVERLVRDMTAIFSADCTLRLAQEKLNEVGQWLPIDGDPEEPLGSLVEHNSTGPLRLGFGGWRDLLLGIQFTNGLGELITAGGMTVKNVAGYDLTKFMVGQHGIFGRLVTLTARTYRRPDAALFVRYGPREIDIGALMASPLRPQWALLTSEGLCTGYLADEQTIAWYEVNLLATEPVEVLRSDVAADVERRRNMWSVYGRAQLAKPAFRASVPPARLKEFVARLGQVSYAADAAFGIVVGATSTDADAQTIREAAGAVGGAVRFGSAADDLDVSTKPGER